MFQSRRLLGRCLSRKNGNMRYARILSIYAPKCLKILLRQRPSKPPPHTYFSCWSVFSSRRDLYGRHTSDAERRELSKQTLTRFPRFIFFIDGERKNRKYASRSCLKFQHRSNLLKKADRKNQNTNFCARNARASFFP